MKQNQQSIESGKLSQILEETLGVAHAQQYAGYNKHDGLNSPLLRLSLGWAKWPRLVGIQSVMRFPYNLRPLLLTPKTKNPKGFALFAQAYLDNYQRTNDPTSLENAKALLDWLLENPSQGFKGLSWGYPYPWQDVGFFAPTNFPNRVVTCWVGFAFINAAKLTGEKRYLNALPQIADFLTNEPNVLEDTELMKCYSYVPDKSVNWAVMDVPALVGAFLAEAGALLEEHAHLDHAKRLLNWVIDKQTDYGAWYYTHPPSESHITHDNYHTAIILDCIDRYMRASSDESYLQNWSSGMAHYKRDLFLANGAPKWMNDQEQPHDVHGAANGILCFLRAAKREPSYQAMATQVMQWTLAHLYLGKGQFAWQERNGRLKKTSLMRWCNGWMSWAMSHYLLEQKESEALD